ncbi:hypothetical protein J6590_048390 [Homalodisca vitripennis]|nr:hypothetical protein J6590_048390 [Homalodisca vitripennis]
MDEASSPRLLPLPHPPPLCEGLCRVALSSVSVIDNAEARIAIRKGEAGLT